MQMIEAGAQLLAGGQDARGLRRQHALAAARLPPADADILFMDDHAYRLALAGHMMNVVRQASINATINMPPGVERMRHAILAYMDANQRRPWLRDLLDAVACEPESARIRQVRNHGYVLLFQMEFMAGGIMQQDAAGAAHVAMAMVQETVRCEREHGAVLPEMRDMVCAYFDLK